MAAETPNGRAGELLARYIEQMREAGEDEVYLSPDTVRTLRGEADRAPAPEEKPAAPQEREPAGGGAPGRSGGKPASGGPRDRGARGGDRKRPARIPPERTRSAGADVADQDASELPEPEVVDVQLAVGAGAATRDMFTSASPLEDATSLAAVEEAALACEKCELARGRNNVVFGVGDANASLMFIGEAPGRDEDLQGIPFVGRAGQLLDKILAAAGIARDDVYIGNIIKCRPPNNRTPLTSEIEACMPYLAKQIECIRPKIICTLGLPATQTLLGVRGSMGSLRGKIYRHGDILIIPTYHPAAALRDPRYKKPIWEDFQILKRKYSNGA
jgi:DNA polymerase